MNYFLERAKENKCNNEENIKLLFNDLADFLNVNPQLPSSNKQFVKTDILAITVNQTREEIVNLVSESAKEQELALLSLYTYRQMDKIDWKPFIKAALERNPVSLEGLKWNGAEHAYQLIFDLPNDSVYDGKRLAQPDEVWNFGHGDGIEKAILFANYLYHEMKQMDVTLTVEGSNVRLQAGDVIYRFHSEKDLLKKVKFGE